MSKNCIKCGNSGELWKEENGSFLSKMQHCHSCLQGYKLAVKDYLDKHGRCPKHPTYKAYFPPRAGKDGMCEKCKRLWKDVPKKKGWIVTKRVGA